MADREHEDHRSFGEKLFGRHDRDDERDVRGGENRSWNDDQGSGYNRQLYRGDNEPRGRGDARHDQGQPTYGNRGPADPARRSNFREEQRYDDSGWTAQGAGGGGSRRNEDEYGMGRRDYSRFERDDGDRDYRQGAGSGGSSQYGAGGYPAGGYGRTGYGQGGYGGDRGESRLGGAEPPRGPAGGRDQDRNRSAQQFYGEHNQYGGAQPGQSSRQGPGHEHDHDLEPHYRDWRERRLADYDRDYAHWRETQAKKHDDEYRGWRDQRRGEFHSEFETWRSSRGGSQDQTGASASGSQPPVGARGEGDLTGHGVGQGLPPSARSGAPSREATWSSGAGGGTGQGSNRGGGSLAQGVPNGGIAPGGGNYGEEYPTSGVGTAGGFSADTAGARPASVPLHSTGGQPGGGETQSQSQTQASGTDAPVGANAALDNVAAGQDNKLNPDHGGKTDEERKS